MLLPWLSVQLKRLSDPGASTLIVVALAGLSPTFVMPTST